MKNWKLVANVLYEYLVNEGKIDPDDDDYKPEEYEDQQCEDWIELIKSIISPKPIGSVDIYELVKKYPRRHIGDTAVYDPKINDTHFVWRSDSKPIPAEFQPDTSSWFKLLTR